MEMRLNILSFYFIDLLTPQNLQNLSDRNKIYLDGFVYNYERDTLNGKRKFLHCQKNNIYKCRGRAIIENEHIEVTIAHNHKSTTTAQSNSTFNWV
jgi:hypothetical protein